MKIVDADWQVDHEHRKQEDDDMLLRLRGLLSQTHFSKLKNYLRAINQLQEKNILQIDAEYIKNEDFNYVEESQTINSEIDKQFEQSFLHTRAINERSQELKRRRNERREEPKLKEIRKFMIDQDDTQSLEIGAYSRAQGFQCHWR